ncbi:MAG TPA: acylneuraminate cytidylyltransferase family protein [Bacillota bacterium]|nr:acylneuraminate cytidylyltransferase family protein [Bacillota bacterium]
MDKAKTILGIIPARGGSKGLPRKNLRDLAGKPLIAWTIETALKSECFSWIIVNTDDPTIATVGEKYGAQIPFLRPAELATDQAKSMDVILHTIKWYESQGECFDLVTLLQPTSPLRNVLDIQEAFKLFAEKNAKSVVSVCECEHTPQWMNTIGPDLSMKGFLAKEIANTNRQGLKTYYRLNGAVYIAQWNYLKETGSFFGEDTYAYIMPQERSIDIDSELDLKLAELIINQSTR